MDGGYLMPAVGSASALARSSGSPSPLMAGADSISQANYIAAQLRQSNRHLIGLERILAQNQGNRAFVVAGKGISNARKRYLEILQAYQHAYHVAFGNDPDSTGLSDWKIYVASGVGFSTIVSAALELYEYIIGKLEPETQTQLAAQQNVAYAMNQATAAHQAGDLATYRQWLAVAKSASRDIRNFSGLGDDAPPPPAIDPSTGLPVSSTPPPSGYGPSPQPISTLPYILSAVGSVSLAPFGGGPPQGWDTLDETSGGTVPITPAAEDSSYFIPGSSFSDVVYNAATGSISPAQSAAIQEQETQQLIQAGASPQTAAQQSASDVNATLKLNNAAPSQSWLAWLQKNWWMVAAGAAGIFVLPKLLDR